MYVTTANRAVGFWSAILATVFSLTYVVAQLAEWLGWLGSDGGPASSSTTLGIAVLLTPSLLLGSSFLVLLVSVHQAAPREKKVWSQAALAFGTVYAVLISMTYFVQLTFVGPRIAEARTAGIEVFLFVPFDSFLYSVDLLGYSFMSLATLFAAPVFATHGAERIARWFLIANGLLLPFLVGQLYLNVLIWPASAWAITFPGATGSIALLFHRSEVGALRATVA
ncbi:MAG: hypothetical protein R3E98_07185 [Gemmatimonadota bacterium]